MSASETNLRQTLDFLCQQKIVAEFTKKICERVQVGKIAMSLGGTKVTRKLQVGSCVLF